MGDFNQSVVLEAIRRTDEGISRIELVAATGLSAQTVTNITRRLLEQGLIAEGERRISGPGKPRTTLRLVTRSRFAIGIHLDPAVITVVLLDLAGDVIDRRVRRTPRNEPRAVIRVMAEAAQEVVERNGVERERIAGVGVAAPGPLDAERGTVIDPPKLHDWHRVPLRDELASVLGLPVELEKDTTAAAFAELWTGDAPVDVSLLFVYLGIGIGAGIVRDGEVIRGVSRNAGEIGHIMVDPDGPMCACGSRGCVEVVCTPQAIVERAERAGIFADDRVGSDARSVDDRFRQLCERAEAGESAAEAVLVRASADLGVLISAAANLLDVDRVVLGGPFWSRTARVHLRELPEILARRSATRAVREPVVVGAAVGDDVAAVGAGCMVLADVLSPRAASLMLGEDTDDGGR